MSLLQFPHSSALQNAVSKNSKNTVSKNEGRGQTATGTSLPARLRHLAARLFSFKKHPTREDRAACYVVQLESLQPHVLEKAIAQIHSIAPRPYLAYCRSQSQKTMRR